jgi:hypothetical protein
VLFGLCRTFLSQPSKRTGASVGKDRWIPGGGITGSRARARVGDVPRATTTVADGHVGVGVLPDILHLLPQRVSAFHPRSARGRADISGPTASAADNDGGLKGKKRGQIGRSHDRFSRKGAHLFGHRCREFPTAGLGVVLWPGFARPARGIVTGSSADIASAASSAAHLEQTTRLVSRPRSEAEVW